MQTLHQSIRLEKAINLDKQRFVNEEIYPQVNQSFTCCTCNNKVDIHIQPFKTGSAIDNLYKDNKILDKAILLDNKIAIKASPDRQHWGELLHNDLPTLYFLVDCTACKEGHYIGFFSYGERQPGLDVLSISGLWKYSIV